MAIGENGAMTMSETSKPICEDFAAIAKELAEIRKCPRCGGEGKVYNMFGWSTCPLCKPGDVPEELACLQTRPTYFVVPNGIPMRWYVVDEEKYVYAHSEDLYPAEHIANLLNHGYLYPHRLYRKSGIDI